MKTSLIRTYELDEDTLNKGKRITNRIVKEYLIKKYELRSPGDITEFAVTEENGNFERGVYKIRTFGQGEIVVKVLRKNENDANIYHEDIKNTHLAWQQDSSLSHYILKVNIRSKKPDYNKTSGLLFMEFETARETLSQRMARKDQYTEEQRANDFRELVNSVNYLHKRGDEMGRNFHGDLKPDNIFFVEHKNADGRYVDFLKIGDIEESLGTLPYRDLCNASLRDWQRGNLPPTEKKDDIMALKMIFLELAYDFCLFDFCSQLLAQGISELNKFLEKNALERKEVIEKNGNKQTYFNKDFCVDDILNSKNIQKMQENIFHKPVISKDIPGEEPVKKVPVDKESITDQQIKYIKTKEYKIYFALLVLLNFAVIWKNPGLYVYLSIPWIYDFYQAVVAKPDFWMAIITLVIPLIGTWGLSSMKNKKGFDFKDILVHSGTFVTILFMFCSIELMTHNFPKGIESNDYLQCLYQANTGNTGIPGFLLPIRTSGVKIDGLEEKFLFDYDKNFKLILSDGKGKVQIDHSLITENFLKANKEGLIKLFGKNIASEEDIHNFLNSGDIRRIVGNLSDEGRRALLLSGFICTHWEIISTWEAPPDGKFDKMMEIIRRYHDEKYKQSD